MSKKARWEYLKAIWRRYQGSEREAKQHILNEFCSTTGYNRKYAIWKLNGPCPPPHPQARQVRNRAYHYKDRTLKLIERIWREAGFPCSQRLKAIIPDWMPAIRREFNTSPELQEQILAISARQIDRRLKKRKRQERRRLYGRTKPGRFLKHHIPIRTVHWNIKTPGYCEVDLVSHSGNNAAGLFAYSVNLTDIFTGWVETRAVLGKGEQGVVAAIEHMRQALPFPLLGLDCDNGSEFINAHLQRYCQLHHIEFTRARPYCKEDNAHIEQKNWTHVRRLVGWERYDTIQAVTALNSLYAEELSVMMNLFQPSAKLKKKVLVGSRLRRYYDPPQTPLARLLAHRGSQRFEKLLKLKTSLNPFQLSHTITRKIAHILALANSRVWPRIPGNASFAHSRSTKNTQNRPPYHFPTSTFWFHFK